MGSAMKLREKLCLGVFCIWLIDFFFNGWVGINYYSDKALVLPLSDVSDIVKPKGAYLSIDPLLFLIQNPKLVGEAARAEKERLANLLREKQEKLNGKSVHQINLDDYEFSLLAVSDDVGDKTAFISVSEKGKTFSLHEMKENSTLHDILGIEHIGLDFVRLLPVKNEENIYNFNYVNLFIYKPNTKKEVL